MTMQTDVQAKSLTTSGTAYAARTRVRGMLVVPGTANGSVTVYDGGASGTEIMAITTFANGEPFSVIIPANGVLFETDVYVALSGTGVGVTVFHG